MDQRWGDVKAEQPGQLLRGLAGDGVAPGAELRQLIAVLVKGQVAVHHGGNAHGPHRGQRDAELVLHVPIQIGVAGLEAGVDILHGVGPDSVFQPILPVVAAGGHGDVVFVQQHRFDAGGAQLNAQNRVFPFHISYLT